MIAKMDELGRPFVDTEILRSSEAAHKSVVGFEMSLAF